MLKISPCLITNPSSDMLVTSFPLKWGQGDGERHDILDFLLGYLTRRDRPPLLSICDLASLIVQRCVGLIGSQHRRLPPEYNIWGMFAKAIGKIVSISCWRTDLYTYTMLVER